MSLPWIYYPYPIDYKTIDDWEDDQATIAEADAYHLARGNSTWTGDDTVKQQALTRAWDYLRGLNWIEGTFATELPNDVKSAQIVVALRELVDPGVSAPDITKDDFLEKKNIANVIIKEYRSGAPSVKRFKEAEVLLKKYILGYGNIGIVRG
jgi:hypothetical protein